VSERGRKVGFEPHYTYDHGWSISRMKKRGLRGIRLCFLFLEASRRPRRVERGSAGACGFPPALSGLIVSE
jgi:hypothetical protein